MSEKYKLIKYENNGVSVDVRFDETNNTIWLTQGEIAIIFNVNRQAITKSISKENDEFISSTSSYEEQVRIEGNKEVKRKTKLYNLDMIEAISKRSKSNSGDEFIKWANDILKSNNNLSIAEF